MGSVAYLLDTHVFLWAVQEDSKLSFNARNAIENTEALLYVSAISAFEITNKHRIGKLPEYTFVVENYLNIIQKLGAAELPVNTKHAQFAGKFEWPHRDPFDRVLAAQAFSDNLILITNDSVFQSLTWLNILW